MRTRRSFLRTSLAATSALLVPTVDAIGRKKVLPGASIAPAQTADVVYITEGEGSYGVARELYNAAIQTRPKIIARCASEAGIQLALKRAGEENLSVAVKAGGHCFEGFSLNEGGLVADVSPLRDLKLESATGTLTAGAGCRLSEVNRFLLTRGRLLPAGSCGSVGLAGLTLGGGYGLFARKWGLTCDHLRAVRMVDGNGEIRDSRDEPELLWACRGGGNGHFGVVTQLTFETRLAPRSFSAWKFKAFKLDAARASKLLDLWFSATAELPNDAFSAWVMNGSQVTVLLTTIGSREQKGVAKFCRQLRGACGKTSSAGPTSVSKALPWYYGNPGPISFKNASAGYYRGMEDVRAALDGVFEEVLKVPGLIFQVNTLGGAIADGPEGAYPHRAFPYLGEQQAYWEKASQAESRIGAASRILAHLTKAGINRHYANYPSLLFEDWPTAYYGQDNYRRLQALKRSSDPQNRIRHPQSVRLPD